MSTAVVPPEFLSIAPEGLQSRLQALAADFELAYAKNTLRTCGSDWRMWRAFCQRAACEVLPATLESLRAFLLDRIDAGRQRATLEKYLATLSLVHRLAQLPWPLDTMEGRLMWKGLRSTHLQARQRQAQGLSIEEIVQLVAPLDVSAHPRDARDAALLFVAYETMCRRSELVKLAIEDLTHERDGTGRLLLRHSKTDQEAKGTVLALSPEALQRMQRWCAIAGIQTGPLFRSVPHVNKQPIVQAADERYPQPLDEGDVARIFKRRALRGGLDPSRISGHSTRVGATQDLLAANFSGAAIMKQGRWTSERMVVRYGEHFEAGRGAMAQFLKRRQRSDE